MNLLAVTSINAGALEEYGPSCGELLSLIFMGSSPMKHNAVQRVLESVSAGDRGGSSLISLRGERIVEITDLKSCVSTFK